MSKVKYQALKRAGRAPRGPRFARFAAAMAAAPASQDQLCAQSQRRIRPAATVNTSSRIQWLGIGSWALFCAALFVAWCYGRTELASIWIRFTHGHL